MRILVVGGGGREHALVWKIGQSPLVSEVFCAPGNPGIAALARCASIEPSKIQELADHADAVDADLTVVGPELPMVLGLGDELRRRGRTAFCPSKLAAELEGSKAFARRFMSRHGIPSPGYRVCQSLEEARALVESAALGFPLVIKADGLAAGKGVSVASDRATALAVVDRLMTGGSLGAAGECVVFEEFLEGEEVSYFALSDGERAVPLATVQDHKRIFDGDRGPNTGGMGAISPSPAVTSEVEERILEEIVEPTITGMAAEGRPYQGVLFAGLMLTAQGPKVLEFNARFGDPETQVLMMRLRTDVVSLLRAVAEGDLGDADCGWTSDAAACVVVASSGYPEKPRVGDEIHGLASLQGHEDVVAFHAGTASHGDHIVTSGGRVLGVTARGSELAAAVTRAYEAVGKISFEGMHYRRDIGAAALRVLRTPA